MPEELEFRFGAFYCPQCKHTFPYRTHIIAGAHVEATFKCPECGGLMREARSEQFLDTSDDVMYAMYQLDNEEEES